MILPTAELENFAILILRIIVGAIFIHHGFEKLKNVKGSAQGMGLPAWFVFTFALGEFLGGIAAIAGFLTQLAGIGFAIVMLGAIYFKLFKWGKKLKECEFEIVLLAAAVILLIFGAGSISADAVLGLWP